MSNIRTAADIERILVSKPRAAVVGQADQPTEPAAPAHAPRRPQMMDAGAVDREARDAWDADASLRAEFGFNFERWHAYLRAERSGRVAIFAGRRVA